MSARAQHLVTVTTRVPEDVGGPVRLVMPTWTPGSYVMRDYVHHVQRLTVVDDAGTEVATRPDGHTAWVVERGGPLSVTIELYANEPTVRTNHVDDDHALLVAPATFPVVEGCRDREHRVTFAGDSQVHGMLPVDEGTHVAADLDLLVDSAFEVEGTTPFPTVRRDVDGVSHTFVWTGPGPGPDPDETGDAMVAIARALRDLLGGPLPTSAYTYLCTASPDRRGGGLEHRDGSVLQAAVDLLGTADGRARFWSLLAHEYAHLANVKRLVPVELVRPSLTAHVHTPSLWVAEGWTSYYEGVLSTRAGLWEPSRLLHDLDQRVDRARHRPGARLQSVADASWTAWTKAYVADENSANAGNDYYGHGGLLAWCLDLLVRRHRPDSDGLDDAFRLLWATFGDTSSRPPTTGYTPEDVVDAVSEAAGVDLSWFFDDHVTGTEFPPLEDLVDVVGLVSEETVDDDAVARLGIAVSDDDHGVTIDAVERDGPAWQGGLTGGDRLLAIDGLRVRPRRLDRALGIHEPGDDVEVTVFRGPRLRTHRVRLAEPRGRTRLRPVDEASDAQRAAFHRWTGHDLPTDDD
nr:PDZ domain-containing protein [Salsipaludibacter albus]